jgi:hypothetical protein
MVDDVANGQVGWWLLRSVFLDLLFLEKPLTCHAAHS